MNKMLVGVFRTRRVRLFQGLSAKKDLHRHGDITLYSSAVIAKDKNGKIESETGSQLPALLTPRSGYSRAA